MTPVSLASRESVPTDARLMGSSKVTTMGAPRSSGSPGAGAIETISGGLRSIVIVRGALDTCSEPNQAWATTTCDRSSSVEMSQMCR